MWEIFRNFAQGILIKEYETDTETLDVDILSSLLTLDKASKLVLCSLNRSLGRHRDTLWCKCIYGLQESSRTGG